MWIFWGSLVCLLSALNSDEMTALDQADHCQEVSSYYQEGPRPPKAYRDIFPTDPT